MPRDDLVLYLVLAPEFGGTRFGPFEGLEVKIGNAPAPRTDIQVPESLGALPQHVKVIRQGASGALLLTPNERAASVWLWQGQARRPIQINTATAVAPGDSFSLGTPEGPRFRIELGPLPPEVLAARRPKSRPRKFGFGVWFAEARRLFFARLYTISFVSLGARAWYAITSGGIFHPRILLPLLAIMSGYTACGVSSCSALRYRSKVVVAEKSATDCRESLTYAQGNRDGNGAADPFDELVAKITGSSQVGRALSADPGLADLVRQSARQMTLDSSAYAWFNEEGSRRSAFIAWRERIEGADTIDPDTRAFLPYFAAVPERVKGDWDRVVDSTDKMACTRGPIRLTWRQGRHLGFTTLGLDAYTNGDVNTIDTAMRLELLRRTAATVGVVDVGDVPSAAVALTQGAVCAYEDVEDDRADLSRVASIIVAQTNRSAKFVPGPEERFGTVARIAKILAADIPEVDWTLDHPVITFGDNPIAVPLKTVPGGSKVLERTAEIIARRLVIPCNAVLGKDAKKMETVLGKLPEPVPCLVLNYRLTHE